METFKGKYGLNLRIVKDYNFCRFAEEGPNLVHFFRGLISDIEEARGLCNYSVMVFNGTRCFRVQLLPEERGPRYQGSREGCIHCSLDLPVYPLIHSELIDQECLLSGECGLSEFRGQPHVRCSMMRSTAPGFVITPIRHVNSLSRLSDDELSAMWTGAIRALRGFPFKHMKLYTNAQRLPFHLLLAVTMDYESHERIRKTWSMLEMDVWNRLQKLQKFRDAPFANYYLVENGEDGSVRILKKFDDRNESGVCNDEPSRLTANLQKKKTEAGLKQPDKEGHHC